jgi:hypothetical protein
MESKLKKKYVNVSFPLKSEDPLVKHIDIEKAKLGTKKIAEAARSLSRRGARLATRNGKL